MNGQYPDSWPRVRMEEIQADHHYALNGGPFGSKLVSRMYVEKGVPVIRGANLPLDRRFSFDGFVFVSEEKANELSANTARPGDVVFTQRGTLGQVGLIPSDSPYERFVISQSQMKLTVGTNKADAAYIYYCFRNPETVHRITSHASSSGVPHINLDTLRKFEILLPPLVVQRRIASILSTYDDLIENNTRRIAILEEMARRLYEEWFVHFRFPGHKSATFTKTEHGRAPEKWRHEKIRDVCRLKSGYAFKSKTFEKGGEHNLVTIKNVQDGNFNPICENQINEAPDNVPTHCYLETGDILLSLTGNVGRVCIVYGGQFLLNQRVAKIVPTQNSLKAFIYFTFRDTAFRTKLENLATGVAQQNLSPVNTEELVVLRPLDQVLQHFSEFADPVLRHCSLLRDKNANLRTQRDLLLPKLFSGEIDVIEAEKHLADAVA